MWALENCSANMCLRDKGWFMALKQHGQKLPSLEISCPHPIGGLEDAWKTSPTFLCFWSHFQDVKIFLSPFVNARSVNNLDLSNVHSLAYQLDRYLSPVNSLRASMNKITHISKPDIFSPLLQQQIGRKPAVHAQPDFLQLHYSGGGNFNFSLTTDTHTVFKGK